MSGFLLSGKISRLLTRLGTPASGSVASKVDTLHDTRLTSARATKLDNLDAPISGIQAGARWTKVSFTANGTFVPPDNSGFLTCYLVGCGGGGGGGKGDANDGGGGGGGAECGQFVPVVIDMSAGNVSVTVGVGGAGATNNSTAGANGSATSFGTFVSFGGGFGGGGADDAGRGFGGNGSNLNTLSGTFAGSTNPAVEGGQPTGAPAWSEGGVAAAANVAIKNWRLNGSGGAMGHISGTNGGNSGDSFFRALNDVVTEITAGVPAGGYEGGAGASCAFGSGGKREGATGTTNVITPGPGGGGSGGVGAVIDGQNGGNGFLDVYYIF